MHKESSKRKVVIVVPTHKQEFNAEEDISLRQCNEVLFGHKRILAHPFSVNGKSIVKKYCFDGNEVFPDECFSSYANYNNTVRSSEFYKRFLSYEYVLLHELDSFIFYDGLHEWCDYGYDYVGAPLGGISQSVKEYCKKGYLPWWKTSSSYLKNTSSETMQLFNGGLSLRRTKTLYWIGKIWRRKSVLWGRNDDLFWSVVAPAYLPWYRLPTKGKAARFSLMVDVEKWLKKFDGNLPFGCHGWPRYDRNIWRPYFSELGYRI